MSGLARWAVIASVVVVIAMLGFALWWEVIVAPWRGVEY